MIGQMRSVVEAHQYRTIEGQIVDVVSASAYVTVYDALSPNNRTRLEDMSLARAMDVVWKILRHCTLQ